MEPNATSPVDLTPAQPGQLPSPGRTSSPRMQALLLGLVLAAAVLAIYYPVH